MEKIIINSEYYLSTPNEGDIPSFVKHFRDREIHDNTLNIPFPYAEADAKWYINNCREETKRFGHIISFVIRNKNAELIGGAVFHGKNTHHTIAHRDEVAYWLAKQYWGKGIMSATLPVLIKYGEEFRGLKRFEASVFSLNNASEKVLLKCGFQQEGFFKKAFLKNGKFLDGKMFALVRE
jgi:[ribosomal protein S5]-alanine N-acetyltransferase